MAYQAAEGHRVEAQVEDEQGCGECPDSEGEPPVVGQGLGDPVDLSGGGDDPGCASDQERPAASGFLEEGQCGDEAEVGEDAEVGFGHGQDHQPTRKCAN